MSLKPRINPHSLNEKLPQKYQTVLGRRFEDGVGLSLGQWQRLALARAFMRDAEIFSLQAKGYQ